MEPLSFRILSDILNRLESPSLPLSLYLSGGLIHSRNLDGTQRALCVDSSDESLSFLAYCLFLVDDLDMSSPRLVLLLIASRQVKMRCDIFRRCTT